MKLFSIEFKGYYPVGAVALAVAENRESADTLMRKQLEALGLDKEQILYIEELNIKIKNNKEQLIVLLDGEY